MDKAIENLQINQYNNRKIVISTKQGTPLAYSISLECTCHSVYLGSRQKLDPQSTTLISQSKDMTKMVVT
jgi:hypothetical protein